jgi:hypothetical protein
MTPRATVTDHRGRACPVELIRFSRWCGPDPVDPAREQVPDQVVDVGQVAVVDLAVAHLPELHEGRLLG